MKLHLLEKITHSGVTYDDPPVKNRGIILSNFVALTLIAANVLLFLIIPGNHNISGILQLLLVIAIFSFPIILNRWGFTTISRLYECYLPSIVIFWYMSIAMRELETVPISLYDGMRFYLLAQAVFHTSFSKGRMRYS